MLPVYICNFILIFCLIFTAKISAIEIDKTFKTTWKGIEVIGADYATAEKIRNFIKIPINKSFKFGEEKKYKLLCNNFKETSLKKLNCSMLLYGDGDVYLIVDVLDHNYKPFFRSIPTSPASNLAVPKILSLLYKQLDERLSYLMTNKIEYEENHNNCYLDFTDQQLHKIVVKLAHQCQINNELLLKVIHFSTNIEERRMAAILLSWSCNFANLSYIKKWDLLFDPDEMVRNNLARAYSSRLSSVKDKELLKSLIPIYCTMVSLPTNTDRNKALFSISNITGKYPDLAKSINPACINRLSHISEMSILENIGGEAKEILSTVKAVSNG